MPDQNPRDFLLALLSDETRWAIFGIFCAARLGLTRDEPIVRV
jgi:hypothetical protein